MTTVAYNSYVTIPEKATGRSVSQRNNSISAAKETDISQSEYGRNTSSSSSQRLLFFHVNGTIYDCYSKLVFTSFYFTLE